MGRMGDREASNLYHNGGGLQLIWLLDYRFICNQYDCQTLPKWTDDDDDHHDHDDVDDKLYSWLKWPIIIALKEVYWLIKLSINNYMVDLESIINNYSTCEKFVYSHRLLNLHTEQVTNLTRASYWRVTYTFLQKQANKILYYIQLT